MNDIQRAVQQISESINLLKSARKNLNYGGSDQAVSLSLLVSHVFMKF
ncbi:hypothetical protein ACFOLF_12380 [Paenibacillus sepulcri]